MNLSRALIPFLALALAASPALANRIFLNGVEITGLKNRTFNKATVFIDEAGDVRIDAPQYEVKPAAQTSSADTPPPQTPPTVLSKQYFLTVQGNSIDAQYDIAIKVNGVERKFIPAGSPMIIEDITGWFIRGNNAVVIIATKNLGGARRSVSPRDAVTVVIGTGNDSGGIVKIDAVKSKLQCDASQLSDVTRTYQVVAD